MDNFVSDEELIPLETTVVGRNYDVDRYTIFSGGGGPLQNESGTQIGSGTRLDFNTSKVYGGLDSGHPNNSGNYGSIWNIPYQPGEYWDFVFERKLTGRGSANFQKAYKTGAKIRFSTHPDSVYEIKYLHQFTQTSGSSYIRYYTRLDRPLEASISPWQIFRASQDNGNGPVFVDGNQVFVGASGFPPLVPANTDAYVTIDVLKPADVIEISSSEPAIFETEPVERADLDILLGATEENVMMVEGEAHECSEEELVEAIKVGHEAIKLQCQAQNRLAAKVGKVKRALIPTEENEEIKAKVAAFATDRIYAVASAGLGKKERKEGANKNSERKKGREAQQKGKAGLESACL